MSGWQHIKCGKARRPRGAEHSFVGDAMRLATLLAFGIALVAALPPSARATIVHGILTGGNGDSGLANQVYLQNRVSGDLFIAPPKPDGAFSANVPPGIYDLRTERGSILVGEIVVGQAEVNLGNVQVPRSFSFESLFQGQRLAPTQLQVPAPATARLVPGRVAEEPLASRYMRTAEQTRKAAPSPSAANANPMLTEPRLEPHQKTEPVAPPGSARKK